jgi:hypothetical protein
LKFQEFIKMWKDELDPKEMIEIYCEDHGSYIEYLYHVIFDYKTKDYGRHAGLIVRVDSRTGEVIEHEVRDRLGY